jgi:hypothetical protein
MKKVTLVALLFIKCFQCLSQSTPIPGDSLQKYSYSLMGFSNNPIADFGTCFFINNNNNLYLVTAKHTFYNCDTLLKKEYPRFKNGVVFIPSPFNAIQVAIPQTIDTCLGMERDLDILILRVDKALFKDVNTVEKFMLPPFDKVGDIEIFGQGMRADSISVGPEKQHQIYLPKNTFKIYTSMSNEENHFSDSVHYIIEMEKLRIDRWLKGFSGSPVFLQDDASKKWRLCGVLVGGLIPESKEYNGAVIVVKPEYVMEAIKREVLNH